MQVCQSDRSSVGHRRGSWLLDLVIVIFICFIVAAFLFPIFARSRQPGRKSNCQNNLKELAVALQVYWNDYDNNLPSSFLRNRSKQWNSRNFLRFGTKLGEFPPKGRKETYVQVLYDHMHSKDIMWCPSDENKDNPGPNSNVSYYWKTAIDKAWYGDGCKKACRNEAEFIYNADQVVLYERSGFHSGEDGIKNGTQINVAFMDSHVKTINVRNATSGHKKNCAANSNGEPMYFNCEIIEHGGNYETKTLPDGVPAKYVDPQRYCDKL